METLRTDLLPTPPGLQVFVPEKLTHTPQPTGPLGDAPNKRAERLGKDEPKDPRYGYQNTSLY